MKNDKIYELLKENVEKSTYSCMYEDKKKIHPVSILLEYHLKGGFSEGEFFEFYGPEGAGKTFYTHMVCDRFISEHEDGLVVYFDSEMKTGKDLFGNFPNLKLNENFIMIQSNVIEEIVENISLVIDKKDKDIIFVIDTVANLITMDQERLGVIQGKKFPEATIVIGNNLKLLKGRLNKKRIPLILVNQVRQNMSEYGDIWRTPGGKAVHHNVSNRLEFYQNTNLPEVKGKKTKNEDRTGMKIRCIVKKNAGNKSPMIEIPFDFEKWEYLETKDLTTLGLKYGLFTKQENDGETTIVTNFASNTYYGETLLGRGETTITLFLENNPELKSKIREDVLNKLRGEK